jgi:Pyruvate/2-oxoacid:ferredoxin oxidoreductase delta subunit
MTGRHDFSKAMLQNRKKGKCMALRQYCPRSKLNGRVIIRKGRDACQIGYLSLII